MKLDEEKAEKFRHAVEHQYWYQMFLDDLPVWGMVGETSSGGHGKDDYVIFSHSRFDIAYNGERIIQVNLTSENPRKISKGELDRSLFPLC